MKKKFIAALLTATMAMSALAGCGSSGASSTEADTAASGGSSAVSDDAVQNLIDATDGTVTLTVWAGEEDQDVTQKLVDDFKAKYSDVTFDITIGAQSESSAKDTVLTDPEAAADVYTFANDQINDLVNAGALQEVVTTYTYDVASEQAAGAVAASTVNGKLYAYPMTADNGYFLFYDKSVISDPGSLEKMIDDAKAAGKQIAIEFSNGWYLYSFFKANGLNVSSPDGVNTECDWNAAGGTDVAQAIIDAIGSGVVVNLNDGDTMTGIKEGTVCAAINGNWNAQGAEEAWGENYAAAKLPTMNIGGTDKQLWSFAGFKLIGVNPHSKFVGWSMLLAEYLTNEESQVYRFEQRGYGPANIKASSDPAVLANPAIAAFAAQSEFTEAQSASVGGNYWEPAQTLGQILANGNPDGTSLQELLDNAVEGITAAVQ